MPPSTPIKLKLYTESDEELKECTRLIVPWGILKRAVRLDKALDPDNMGEEDIDALAGLIIEVFKGQVTAEELDEHADIGEMITVLQQIVAKARGLVPNPPPAVRTKRKK